MWMGYDRLPRSTSTCDRAASAHAGDGALACTPGDEEKQLAAGISGRRQTAPHLVCANERMRHARPDEAQS